MTARRMHKNLWNFVALTLILLGVVGSLGAWEQGSIGFFQMLVQSALCSGFARVAFQAAARPVRRRRVVSNRRAAARPARVLPFPAA